MSTLSSASTYADGVDAYLDNAGYEEDGSAAKAKAFITACRFLLRFPKRAQSGTSKGGQEFETSPEALRAEITEAQEWLAANDQPSSGTRSTYADFQDFRWDR